MRVRVTLTTKEETILEGDAGIFDRPVDYKKGFDGHLRDIGFWLGNWRYANHGGPDSDIKVFIPWPSASMIQPLCR